MLGTAELAGLRTEAARAYTDRCTIEYVSGRASDGQGGVTDTWGDRATLVPCLIRPLGDSGTEGMIADRMTGAEAWVVVLPIGQTVALKDRIVVTHTDGGATALNPVRRFEVRALPGKHTYAVGLASVCVELAP